MSRKLFILFISIFFFVAFPTNILAKSGCCSGHGGVSCSAGPQGNGNVVCNDGWRGSSCSYSGMVMCGGTSTQTTVATAAPARTAAPATYKPVYTTRPTIRPTIAPTIKPTLLPTTTPTPTISPINTPEVKGAATENLPSPSSTPIATPVPLTKNETFGVLAFLAVIVGLPTWGVVKIVKRLRKPKV